MQHMIWIALGALVLAATLLVLACLRVAHDADDADERLHR